MGRILCYGGTPKSLIDQFHAVVMVNNFHLLGPIDLQCSSDHHCTVHCMWVEQPLYKIDNTALRLPELIVYMYMYM